jgi:SNF2 family DNA or RNA helicase
MQQNVYGRDPLIRRVLIVAPSSLVRNWDREIVYWLQMHRLQAFLVADVSLSPSSSNRT